MNDSMNGVAVDIGIGHFQTGLFTLDNFRNGWSDFGIILLLTFGIAIFSILLISIIDKIFRKKNPEFEPEEFIVIKPEKPSVGPPK